MLQYYDELKEIISRNGYDKNDILIVGSGAITQYGLRANNDIELSLSEHGFKKLPLGMKIKLYFVDHIELSDNVDLFRNRYLSFGMTDKELFDKKLYDEFRDYKMVNPEVELAYKKFKMREKDVDDIKRIKEDENLFSRFDFDKADKYLQHPFTWDLRLQKWSRSKFKTVQWMIKKVSTH